MTDLASSWTNAGAVLTVHRWVTVIGSLLLACMVVLMLCLQFGATSVGMGTVATAIAHMVRGVEADSTSLGTSEIIMVQIRFPRVLMGFLVGASLAAVGVTLQALLRNPLADHSYNLSVSADQLRRAACFRNARISGAGGGHSPSVLARKSLTARV